jgi:uncharacterized protein with HEPN domain
VRDDRERLADVLAAIDRSRRYVQDDRTRFDTDELLQSAVLHWIEIIGEAARGVSDKVRTAHPEVPWRVITDMPNRVSYGYFDIDLDVVWNKSRATCRNSRNLSPGSLPSLTRKHKTRGEQPSGSALADRDIAPVDLTSTDCADGRLGAAFTPRWSGRARGCADPSDPKSVNDSALRSCIARQTQHC